MGRALWEAPGNDLATAPRSADARVDVCVVGAGIAGLSVAYHLLRAGRDVMVLDRGRIGTGETRHTTAHLTNAMDDGLQRLIRMHGERRARLVAASHLAAIERIEAIVGDEDLACDFERLDGFLFDPRGRRERLVDREYEAAHRLGMTCERVDRAPLDGFDTGPALRFPRQGAIHPTKYLHGLATAILRDGGVLHTGTAVDEVHGGAPCRVVTREGHVITADHVVVCTNSPINERIGVHAKQAPYHTYVVAAQVPRGSVTRALFWDTADPYHYARLWSEDDVDWLIVGGEDHKAGEARDPAPRLRRLADWARVRFPTMGAVAFRWSGMVFEPVDGLAYIGHNASDERNVWIVTGDSGQGMTHGTIAGILIPELIQGREHPWAEVYDPSRLRVSLPAALEAVREGANLVGQYVERVLPGSGSTGDIRPGEGAVVQEGGRKLAVYRDESGALHRCSAVCTHLGCVVGWNGEDGRWECGCHGSRFDAYGRVLNGPATRDLERVSPKVKEPA